MTIERFEILLYKAHCTHADVVKLVDTLVLEASAFGVRVRVSPSAPFLFFFPSYQLNVTY